LCEHSAELDDLSMSIVSHVTEKRTTIPVTDNETHQRRKGETMYKRIWLVVVPLIALSLSGGKAVATGGTKVYGEEFDAIIGKDGVNWFASGALGTVRSEPTNNTTSTRNKSIGCWVDSVAGDAMVQCLATTDIGNDWNMDSLRCISHDPAMVAAVGAMNSDSKITFQTPDVPALTPTSGICVHIIVENISKYNVKSP